jgi:hypothetical protein
MILRDIFSNRIAAAVFVAAVLIGVVGGLLPFILFAFFNPFGGNACSPRNPASIERSALFELPPSAENLESTCTGLQGWVAYARFDMHPSDLAAFVNSTYVELPLSSNINFADSPLPAGVTEQDVQAMSSYRYGRVNSTQYFLIDTSDPSKYTVYITRWGGN